MSDTSDESTEENPELSTEDKEYLSEPVKKWVNFLTSMNTIKKVNKKVVSEREMTSVLRKREENLKAWSDCQIIETNKGELMTKLKDQNGKSIGWELLSNNYDYNDLFMLDTGYHDLYADIISGFFLQPLIHRFKAKGVIDIHILNPGVQNNMFCFSQLENIRGLKSAGIHFFKQLCTCETLSYWATTPMTTPVRRICLVCTCTLEMGHVFILCWETRKSREGVISNFVYVLDNLNHQNMWASTSSMFAHFIEKQKWANDVEVKRLLLDLTMADEFICTSYCIRSLLYLSMVKDVPFIIEEEDVTFVREDLKCYDWAMVEHEDYVSFKSFACVWRVFEHRLWNFYKEQTLLGNIVCFPMNLAGDYFTYDDLFVRVVNTDTRKYTDYRYMDHQHGFIPKTSPLWDRLLNSFCTSSI